MSRRRDLLHKNKVEQFKEFLISEGYVLKDSNNCYEVIRAIKDKNIISFYQKNTSDHITTTGYGIILAKRFIEAAKAHNKITTTEQG